MFKKISIFALLLLCIIPFTASAVFKLPDTGQTKCYQDVDPYAEIPCAGTGQDGAYNINPMSYTDNGDGTVKDNNTGLTWQKQDDGNSYNWYQASGTYDVTNNPSSQNVCVPLNLGVTCVAGCAASVSTPRFGYCLIFCTPVTSRPYALSGRSGASLCEPKRRSAPARGGFMPRQSPTGLHMQKSHSISISLTKRLSIVRLLQGNNRSPRESVTSKNEW